MPQPRWSDDSVFVCISEVANLPSQEGDKHQQDAFTATLVLADPIDLNVLTFQQSCRFSAMIFHFSAVLSLFGDDLPLFSGLVAFRR